MSSLKMYNFNARPRGLTLPDGFVLTKFSGEEDIAAWVDICGDGLIDRSTGFECFDREIGHADGPDPYRDTYFIEKDGQKIATFTVVPNMWSSGMGNLHMVACKTEYRGLGLGKFMSDYCLQVLKGMGIEKIYLLTHDRREPAIKTYLGAGYLPVDYPTDDGTDMAERWQKIATRLQIAELPLLDTEGNVKQVLHAEKKVRIGVFGLGRGGFAVEYCQKSNNAELVAICDRVVEKLDNFRSMGVACFDNFDDFINYPNMDAVMLANFGTQHAPFAIQAMKAGKHVISEVLPFQHLKEGVELVEAVEETGKIYAYAENYAYMPCNMEMRKMFRDGTLGTFEYGEGEYLHNCEPGWGERTGRSPENWRNRMPSTFYCTHSIGPLIHISGQRPVKVVGFETAYNARMERMGALAAPMAIEMITLESGAVVKSAHGIGPSKSSYWFCCYGSKGEAECARMGADGWGWNNFRKLYTNLDDYEGQCKGESEAMFYPSDELTPKARDFGHGGGDYRVMYNFCEKILGREADVIDVYEACDMFLPGLFAYRSILAGNMPMDIPNFRRKEDRDLWRNDTACTDPEAAGDMLQPSRSADLPGKSAFKE